MLALPMTLSHVTTPLLGLVDATVVGRLGEAHLLGAVALGAVIFDFVFWSFGSLRMATAGLTAQATGAGDRREVDRTLARALVVAAVDGRAARSCCNGRSPPWRFRLVGASAAVTEALSIYFFIRIWAAPFTLANYVILGSTLGRGRTDLGLVLQVAINVINIVLTATLVLAFGYGVAGAAIGTALAEVIGVGARDSRPAAARIRSALRHLGGNPRPRRDAADPGDESRHHDPQHGADRGLLDLQRRGRARRRRDARGECRPLQHVSDRRIFPRRLRDRGRNPVRPMHRRAGRAEFSPLRRA